MEKDKRKSIRIQKAFVIKYKLDSNKNINRWDTTIVKDISETGMQITSMKYFLPNTVVTFSIKIPFRPTEWIQFKGKVVLTKGSWSHLKEPISDTYIVGVKFIDLKEEQKRLIKMYIDWFLGKGAGIASHNGVIERKKPHIKKCPFCGAYEHPSSERCGS